MLIVSEIKMKEYIVKSVKCVNERITKIVWFFVIYSVLIVCEEGKSIKS